MKKLSTDEICRKCPHETPHSEHVTLLGLELFDRTREYLGVPLSERRMLEACCRLHDIGFAKAPGNHEVASARLVLEKGLSGFTRTQTQCISAAILLHARNFSKHLGNSMVSKVRNKRKVFRLAAYLRIADALDHGHVQDVRILSVAKKRSRLYVSVSSYGYGGNVAWAMGKTDMWNRVFRLPIRISAVVRTGRRPRFYGIVGRKDSVVYGFFKVFMSQFRIIGDNHAGTVAGLDPEHLHDLRVALRRFRAALKIAGPFIGRLSCRRIDRVVSDISVRLGGARDSQVWLSFLGEPENAGRFQSDNGWNDYFSAQVELEKKHLKQLRGLLGGRDYSRFWQKVNYFIRINTLACKKGSGAGSFREIMTSRLLKAHKALTEGRRRIDDLAPEKMHELRKKCRKYRYWAEFAAPVLGADVERFARRLADLTDALGTVHDMDVHWEKLAKNKPFILPSLHSTIATVRRASLARAAVVWKELRRGVPGDWEMEAGTGGRKPRKTRLLPNGMAGAARRARKRSGKRR